MRTKTLMLGLLGLTGSAGMTHVGCGTALEEDWARLTDPALATDGSSTGTGGTSTGGSGAGGHDGGAGGSTPDCSGDPTKDPAIVANGCGVFVSASAPAGGDGTQRKPFNKLSDAITAASGKTSRVYACAESYDNETVTVNVTGALDVYGGFTGCSGGGKAWTWSSVMRVSYTGPANETALVLASGTGTIHVENVNVQAPDATMAGGSSIALYVNGGTVELVSSNVTAGDAMPGANGTDASSTPAQGGMDGNSGGAACSATSVAGAQEVQTTCGTSFSIGASGGAGDPLNGTAGALGLPNNGGGQPGSGDDGTTVGWTCAGNGGTGKDGLPGTSDTGGPGASMMSFGTLDTTGFVGAAGSDGMVGTPGQGGGGGGGVRGGATPCMGQPGSGGASGGSGGSGGCGGTQGGGGKGGGASIALVSASATVTLTSVKLSAGKGGNGGRGGNAQQGGPGSTGGPGGTSIVVGLQPGCNGGAGGKGGDGGPGGGGRGGHSLGIASSGTAPQIDPSNVTTKAAGNGGKGGSNDVDGNDGAGGTAAPCWDFMKNAACM
jgi:hypothetical protein